MRRLLPYACLPFLLLLALPASAQSLVPRFYGGAELGAGFASTKSESNPLSAKLLDTFSGTTNISQDGTSAVFRLFGGYQLYERLAVELGYVQSDKVNTRVSGVTGSGRNNAVYSGSGTTSYSGFDVSVLVRPIDAPGRGGPFLRLGAHARETRTEVTLPGVLSGSYSGSASGTGLLYGLGYDLPYGQGQVRFSLTQQERLAGLDQSVLALSAGYVLKF